MPCIDNGMGLHPHTLIEHREQCWHGKSGVKSGVKSVPVNGRAIKEDGLAMMYSIRIEHAC